jgi:hypothetical protein
MRGYTLAASAIAFLAMIISTSTWAQRLGPECLQRQKEYAASMGPKAWAVGTRSDGLTACGYGAYQSVKRDLETQKARAVGFCRSAGGQDCRVTRSQP